MSIFNSLGSNYTLDFISRSLFRHNSNKTEKVKELIAQKYELTADHVALTYKARHAIELILRSAKLPEGSKVAINGFTCYVVYEAVQKAGLQPVLIDTANESLDFNQAGLANCLNKNQNVRAVIIQNTLGLPVDIEPIEKLCKQHDILIIEDLAQSLGAVYADGRKAGTVGDYTVLSFSQDKPLDVVAGGAAVSKKQAMPQIDLPKMATSQRLKNGLYPFWTGLIRSTYSFGLGRIIHVALKKFHLLATPMSDNVKQMYQMTNQASSLLAKIWHTQQAELTHRQQIAEVYQKELPKEIQFAANHGTASYLRFPIKVSDRPSLVQHLKGHDIYIGDTWYDAPIGPKKYLTRTNYKTGECSNAEKLAAHIVNLPTHLHVTPQIATDICATIKQWLALQQK